MGHEEGRLGKVVDLTILLQPHGEDHRQGNQQEHVDEGVVSGVFQGD